ncbi:MAG: hypothetical protein DI566_07765 [Microbacterium sp.]|nr:MAG: hypothetical protein DI566_07765 [Microbacterium sp.]
MKHQRERRGRGWLRALIVLVGVLLVASMTSPIVTPAVQAADAPAFDPGMIVSDENFYDGNALTVEQVQGFLVSRNRCGQGPNCLAAYRQDTPSMPANKYCTAMSGVRSESAASIIARVGRACGISQQAIIVILQKEQSLITSTSPTQWGLDHAMGHACPDTAPCDPAFAGFFYQVYYGARQFQVYRSDKTYFNWYKANAWNNIRFSPVSECGTGRVFIRNEATVGLYFYTPYQPNQAALDNLYGLGDVCSSYGNRNFWRLWTDWFGDPRVNARSPLGVIKDMWATEDGIAFWGWALDPDYPTTSAQLRIEVGGTVTYWTASSYYPQVESGFPGAGPNHGFGGTVPAPPGTTQNICVTVVNQGGGVDTSLGCRAIDLPPRVSPRGEIKELWTTSAGIHAWGWAIDPDAVADSVQLSIRVDQTSYEWLANAPYPAGPSLIQGAGPNHGWGGTLPVGPGTHSVCITMKNINAGVDGAFGCRSVTVPTVAEVSPHGEVKEIWSSDGSGISLWGWAVDPDAQQSSVPVTVQVDSNWYAWTADQPSEAARSAYPDAGANHGWGGTVPASPGHHWVCVYFGNIGDGVDVKRGCYELTVASAPQPNASPVTKLMGAWSEPGAIILWGYAADPDAATSSQVVIQVDSSWYLLTADLDYPPAISLFAGASAKSGYYAKIPTPAGRHWLCAYAINRNDGQDTAPQCTQVSVP